MAQTKGCDKLLGGGCVSKCAKTYASYSDASWRGVGSPQRIKLAAVAARTYMARWTPRRGRPRSGSRCGTTAWTSTLDVRKDAKDLCFLRFNTSACVASYSILSGEAAGQARAERLRDGHRDLRGHLGLLPVRVGRRGDDGQGGQSVHGGAALGAGGLAATPRLESVVEREEDSPPGIQEYTPDDW